MKTQDETNKEGKRPRYYVGRVGDGWGCPSKSFTDLSRAIIDATKYQLSKRHDGGWGRVFVAKAISYELKPDEKTGQVEVVPVGDFESSQPYYLIEDYSFDGGKAHSISSDKDLAALLVTHKLPKLDKDTHLAHGLELDLKLTGERK